MIRYIELTPESEIPFQSGKIVRTLVSDGDTVAVGDALFLVDAQGKEIEVIASATGKINELIVFEGDIIHKLTSMLVLETKVSDTDSNASSASETSVKTSPDPKKDSTAKTATKKAAPKPSKPKPQKTTANTKSSQGDAESQKSLDFDQISNNSASELTKTQENNTTMSEIKVPDLGGADAVEVIDILVSVGDSVNTDDPLMTVESDKASMDIPASSAGTITEILVSVGDNVSEGDVVFKTDGSASEAPAEITPAATTPTATTPATPTEESAEKPAAQTNETPASTSTGEPSDVIITIPDLGGASDVDVIDLLIAEGDTVAADQAVITVESDKASMDVPTSHAGVVKSITVNVGDQVNEGDQILLVTISGAATAPAQKEQTAPAPKTAATPVTAPAAAQSTAIQSTATQNTAPVKSSGPSHATPSVRRLARELGVDLSKIVGTSRKNRISKDDVKAFVKQALAGGIQTSSASSQASGGAGIPEIPAQDFSKFGEIELQALNKIKRVTAQHLHRAWLNVPHVTHNDETNIESLEEFRKTLNAEYAKQGKGIKLSPLAFIVKVVVNALQNYPQFNSSLENGGNNLILKKYYNIGIAVETPNGLVVPVIHDADKLTVAEIALKMGDLAKKARDGKLKPSEMQGGTFSISSLGGIGGTNFTPIVNAPEVAILGVSRTKVQPVWNGSEFVPAPILPLSLSYDHRVIDGAEAARFTRHIAAALEDIRRLTV